ncbi:MAG: transposase [Planctomycetes bacterium]|nr:transposase [Planctomycetota bacterium]
MACGTDSPTSSEPEGWSPAGGSEESNGGGIFWILDNGAKWEELPKRFGSKSTVHRWFQRSVNDGLLEAIMRDAGRCVEERDGYRLYECFIHGTLAKARGGGGLGQPGHALDQGVPIAQQPDEHLVKQVVLPEDHPMHLLEELAERLTLELHLFGDLLDIQLGGPHSVAPETIETAA